MTECEEQIVRELQGVRELLVKILESVNQVNESVKGVSEDICGWTCYPYLEEVHNIFQD